MPGKHSNIISSGQDPLLTSDELEEGREDSTDNTARTNVDGGSRTHVDGGSGAGQQPDLSAAESINGAQADLLANIISYGEVEDLQGEQEFLAALGLQVQEEEEGSGLSRKRAASPEATDQTEAKRQRCVSDENNSLLCNCCLQMNKKFVMCPAGHIVCKMCIKFGICECITSDAMKLTCPAASCGEEVSIDSLSPLEPNLLIELLKEHVHKKETLATQNLIQDMVEKTTCPKCQAPAVLEKDSLVYHCTEIKCHAIFCRFCNKAAASAVLSQFEITHDGCRILQYGGQSSPSDLSAPPVHWDVFTIEGNEFDQDNENQNQTSNKESQFQFFYNKFMPVFPGEIPYGLMGGYMTVKLRPVAREFQDIKAYFQKSSTKLVTDIYRIQNITCWEKYVIKRKHLIREVGAHNINERMLYHGTSREALELIISEGFDLRKPTVTGSNFGKGIYFSDRAENSERYCKSTFLIMACVLLGQSTVGAGNYTHPPYDTNTGKMFHSCVDALPDPTMFVVFANDQCYPAYIIEFK